MSSLPLLGKDAEQKHGEELEKVYLASFSNPKSNPESDEYAEIRLNQSSHRSCDPRLPQPFAYPPNPSPW